MTESKNRVLSMAMVHDHLYKKDNLSKIDFKNYLSELINGLVKSFPINNKLINVEEDLQHIELEITKALPIGLIINKAITNALKHAFVKENENPLLKIKLQIINTKVYIFVSDNGIGFNGIKNENSLGLSLIETLADQIDAIVNFKNDLGTTLHLEFSN